MLHVPLSKAYIKRTIRPLYGWTQTTPTHVFLDPAWDRSVNIYPGMCMMRTSGDNVTLIDATGYPMGLAALYVGGDGIDEPLDSGINAFSVWTLGPDAEFEVLAPAFDQSLTWTDPGDGTKTLVHAYESGANRGRLCPVGTSGDTTRPVARLLKVNDANKITIGGLVGTTA